MAGIEQDFDTVRDSIGYDLGAYDVQEPLAALSRIQAAFKGGREAALGRAENLNILYNKAQEKAQDDASKEAERRVELEQKVERLNHEIELRETARMNHERDIERLREERYELERRITRYRKGLKLDAWLFYPESWEYKRATAVLEEDTE
jgi:predicted RNase H-like nuclease (RuvC/YqgF family)